MDFSVRLSYQSLKDSEAQRLFAVLSVFAGGASKAALTEVFSANWDKPMRELARKSLVIAEGEGDGQRFRLLTPTRDFAAGQLEPDERQRCCQRHAEYFLTFAKERDAKKYTWDEAQAWNEMETEFDNIRAAMDWAKEAGKHRICAEMACAMSHFMRMRGLMRERQERLERGLEAVEHMTGNVALVANLKHLMGDVWYEAGDYAQAKRFYEESRTLRTELGDRAGYAHSTHNMGHTLTINLSERRRCYKESLTIWRDAVRDPRGTQWGTAIATASLGDLAKDEGNIGEAERLNWDSLVVFRQLGDQRHISIQSRRLGEIAFNRGEYTGAHPYFDEALQAANNVGWQSGRAWALHFLGKVALAQRHLNEARRCHEESLTIWRRIGDPHFSTAVSALLEIASRFERDGWEAFDRGDYTDASPHFREASQIRLTTGNTFGPSNLAAQLERRAIEAHGRQDYAEEWCLYHEVLETAKQFPNPFFFAWQLNNLGYVTIILGNYMEARRLLEQSVQNFRDLVQTDRFNREYKTGLCYALESLSSLAIAEGRAEEVGENLGKCLELARELGIKYDIAMRLNGMGIIKKHQGDYPVARQHYERSEAILRQIGEWAWVTSLLNNQALLAIAEGRYRDARALCEESWRIKHDEINDLTRLAYLLYVMGKLELVEGNYSEAQRLYQEALQKSEQENDNYMIHHCLHGLGDVAFELQDYAEAEQQYRESLRVSPEIGMPREAALSLGQLGLVSEATQEVDKAAVPLFVAERVLKELKAPEARQYREALHRIERQVGVQRFVELRRTAEKRTVWEAVDLVLRD